MSILQNAIDSIELGIEDFRANSPKRLISATRNIFAGVLLLFKYKLSQLSIDNNEALLKATVLPEIVEGKVVWKGRGKLTANVKQIQERFTSLGITVDWEKLAARCKSPLFTNDYQAISGTFPCVALSHMALHMRRSV